MLFCLDGLMQSVAESSSEHQTACKLIYDDDLAFFYDVVYVALHQGVGFQRLLNVV